VSARKLIIVVGHRGKFTTDKVFEVFVEPKYFGRSMWWCPVPTRSLVRFRHLVTFKSEHPEPETPPSPNAAFFRLWEIGHYTQNIAISGHLPDFNISHTPPQHIPALHHTISTYLL
jgi:hypothetical protein